MEAATPAESADGLCTESEAAGARTEDPGANLKGTKTKNATSCGNVFETNILLASPERVRQNENQHIKTNVWSAK